jgi:hypothetical protein
LGGGGDSEQIKLKYKIEMNGIVDVASLAIKEGLTNDYKSLSDLSQDLLNIKKLKSPGGWKKQLLPKNIRYGCKVIKKNKTKDAYMGYSLAIFFYEKLGSGESLYDFFKKHFEEDKKIDEKEKKKMRKDLHIDHLIKKEFKKEYDFQIKKNKINR